MTPEVTGVSEVIDFMGGRLEVTAEYRIGSETTVLLRTHMAPRRVVPLHRHSDPEGLYVLGGALEVWLELPEPGWRAVGVGQSIFLADGVKHALRNPGDAPLDMILTTNARLTRFFRDAGRRPGPGDGPGGPTPERVRHMVQVAERFGYWIATPEEILATVGPSGLPDVQSP